MVALATSIARGEHASIDLEVIAPEGRQEAFADHEPPEGGVNPRPRLALTAGEPLVLNFQLTNIYPHGLVKDVTVRYFVVRVDKLGAKELPALGDQAVLQGAVTMNFKPKCRVGARLKFKIDTPGIYLARVDTLNSQSDHEHFSAIDLEVK